MIAASVQDSEPVLRVLLQKGAEINEKSRSQLGLLRETLLTPPN